MHRLRTAVSLTTGALLLSTLLAGQAQAASTGVGAHRYHTINLGSLGGGRSEAQAVSDRRTVVGWSIAEDGVDHPFLWRHGKMIDLGHLDSANPQGTAYDVNNRDQVVGVSYHGWDSHAFLWERGVMRDLGTLGGASSLARAINDRGEVVGDAQTADGTWHAFLWSRGTMKDLGVKLLGIGEATYAINMRTQVVGGATFDNGVYAYRWERGTVTNLGAPNDARLSEGLSINDRGDVVGFTGVPGDLNLHACLWRNGKPTDLGVLGGGSVGGSRAASINNRSQVVGTSTAPGSFDSHPFLWQNGTMADLTTRGVSASAVPSDINNRGDIAGSISTDGGTQAVLMV